MRLLLAARSNSRLVGALLLHDEELSANSAHVLPLGSQAEPEKLMLTLATIADAANNAVVLSRGDHNRVLEGAELVLEGTTLPPSLTPLGGLELLLIITLRDRHLRRQILDLCSGQPASSERDGAASHRAQHYLRTSR